MASALAGAAGAQTNAPGASSIAQAIESAWRRSAENPEAQGRVRRAEADRAASESPWAAPPAVELDLRQGRAEPTGRLRESEVGVAWPLWLPGQRAARGDAAQAELQASQQALQAAKRGVAASVREAALAVTAQEAESREADLQVRLLRALADDVERRVKAGDLARADAMAARAEQLAGTVALNEAQQRLQAARGRWKLLTGMASVPNAEVWVDLSAQPSPDHPELTSAASNLERARRRLASAERSRRDPPELGVRYRREDGPASAGSQDSVGVSLRIPFATADRNGPLMAAALSDLEIAQSEEQRVRDRLGMDTENARAALKVAREQLQAERSRATLLRERAELIERSFRAGETALPDTLRALALAAQADTAVVRQQAALSLAQARLHHLLGYLP